MGEPKESMKCAVTLSTTRAFKKKFGNRYIEVSSSCGAVYVSGTRGSEIDFKAYPDPDVRRFIATFDLEGKSKVSPFSFTLGFKRRGKP